MGISYESESFTVNSGESKIHRITLPLNSTLKSASLRIVSNDNELCGNYTAALYISNNYDVTGERIFIPLDYGTVSFMLDPTYVSGSATNLEIDDLDNYIPFQTIGGFYDFKVKKEGMQLIASFYHASEYYTGSGTVTPRPLDVFVYYELEEPEKNIRFGRRRRWEIILIF